MKLIGQVHLQRRNGERFLATVLVDEDLIARALFDRASKTGTANALGGGVLVKIDDLPKL
jgi:hypothetical protein